VTFEKAVLARNQHLAAHNRHDLRRRDVVAFNLMSSPGAGKTTLLERTLRTLRGAVPIAVIEGDQETQADADRIRAAGGRSLQINTGTGCHLDAAMIGRALAELDPRGGLLFIENVGNLVCPALFDLGEAARVVIASVTEGEDKPLKYPHMFRAADLVLLNKIDLLPHVDFSVATFAAHVAAVQPRARLLSLSARSGEGFDVWLALLRDARSGQALG
jgi:hydrogenase nickel incorporation protein HypB